MGDPDDVPVCLGELSDEEVASAGARLTSMLLCLQGAKQDDEKAAYTGV